MVDVFVWESVFRELNLYAPEVWSDTEVMSGRGMYEVMARGEAHLLRTHSLGVRLLASEAHLGTDEDLGLAVMPQGVSFELDQAGRPARSGTRRSTINGWLWGVPASTRDPLRSVRLARYLSDTAQQQSEVDEFSVLPVRHGVTLRGEGIAGRIGPVFARQLELSGGVMEPRGTTVEQAQGLQNDAIRAWRNIVVERGYRGSDEEPIDVDAIRRHLEEIFSE
jgi:ABC-type glycerol-3-phosphate transport system substrate-binding protein